MAFGASVLSAALMGSVAYGAADFIGSRAALRLSTFAAIAVAQTISVAFIAHIFLQSGQSPPNASHLWPCLAAGCAYVAGLALLYRGLAHGRVGIVAPLCAVFSILVPLAGDFELQRELDGKLLLGVALCASAAVLIGSSSPLSTNAPNRSVWLGIVSGLAYGTADLIMGRMPAEDASSAMLGMRLVAAGLAVTAFAVSSLAGSKVIRRRARGPQGSAVGSPMFAYSSGSATIAFVASKLHKPVCTGLLLAGSAGILDMLGQIGYVASATQGSMGVAAALVGLFPGVSVLLAVTILHERIGSTQLLGLAVGAMGVILVSS